MAALILAVHPQGHPWLFFFSDTLYLIQYQQVLLAVIQNIPRTEYFPSSLLYHPGPSCHHLLLGSLQQPPKWFLCLCPCVSPVHSQHCSQSDCKVVRSYHSPAQKLPMASCQTRHAVLQSPRLCSSWTGLLASPQATGTLLYLLFYLPGTSHGSQNGLAGSLQSFSSSLKCHFSVRSSPIPQIFLPSNTYSYFYVLFLSPHEGRDHCCNSRTPPGI